MAKRAPLRPESTGNGSPASGSLSEPLATRAKRAPLRPQCTGNDPLASSTPRVLLAKGSFLVHSGRQGALFGLVASSTPRVLLAKGSFLVHSGRQGALFALAASSTPRVPLAKVARDPAESPAIGVCGRFPWRVRTHAQLRTHQGFGESAFPFTPRPLRGRGIIDAIMVPS